MTHGATRYRDAGVDRGAAHELLDRIQVHAGKTARPGVLGKLGGFSALFTLDQRYRDPVLVSTTDGVGTKLMLATRFGAYEQIGLDLVAMCVNDVLVYGAEPLFFLDYLASSDLATETAERIVAGIAQGCSMAGCALVGGETAQMPGLYAPGLYDLAGFCVGAVERAQLIDGSAIRAGDALIGIASSGLHANGFSLIRQILDARGTDPDTTIGDRTLRAWLTQPTTLYASDVLPLLREHAVRGMAHITGGGLHENIIRTVPQNLGVRIHTDAWPQPPIFGWLQREGGLSAAEMQHTFNCGIGYVLWSAPECAPDLLQWLHDRNISAWRIGEAVHVTEGAPRTVFIEVAG